jgi:hypothetical protein
MSFETNASGRSPRRATRRIVGSLLGLAVVAGTAATAQASSHDDGFFAHGSGKSAAMSASPTGGYGTHAMPTKKTDADDRTMHPSTTSSTYSNDRVMHPSTTNSTDRDDWMRTQNWTWSGSQRNRYAFTTLGDQNDSSFNQLLGINNSGTIVGYYGSGADASHPNKGYWVTPWYSQGDFGDENYPGAAQTQVVGVNTHGATAGFYVDADGTNHGFVNFNDHYDQVDAPWTDSKPSFNQLLGINDDGIAVGFWNDADGNAHGYTYNVWTKSYTPLKWPHGATGVTATGINDKGEVVGFFVVGKTTFGFVWSYGHFRVIKLGNGTDTQVLGVNNEGVVVGSYVDSHGTTDGFVLSNGRLRTVMAPHSTSTVVNGLNDKGQIVGFYEDQNKLTKGFVAHQ